MSALVSIIIPNFNREQTIAETLDSNDPEQAQRIEELKEISRICAKVPAKPAETVHEAVQSIWTSFVCLHCENANSALSIGRLDQMLQPYFLNDITRAKSDQEKEEIVKKTIELVGSLFVRTNDHDPCMPNVGWKLFGGSSSDDTVTVGGVDKDGNNAVNDMSFIILKTNEMLGFQDPNMNARYYSGINSKEYLRRLCEVNVNMGASPSIHNDKTMIEALVHEGFTLEDARDWAATGCVEPTIVGRHYGHTNCMLLNLVAPLEMALNNGVIPLTGDMMGIETGDVKINFVHFEDFLNAYKAQLKYLAEQSIEINNFLGESHKFIHPTPLLSGFYEGPLEKGKDLIQGGAIYNTSNDSWTTISSTGAPSARTEHAGVYDSNTNSVIIWGGWNGSSYFNTGGVLAVAANTWQNMTTTNAPASRKGHTAIWTGDYMIVFGGQNASGALAEPKKFKP